MKKVGIIGWRGMVGSVLMERMLAENDFAEFEPLFFSTSQAGQSGPDIGRDVPLVQDAHDLQRLAEMDILVSCQGGGYTQECYPQLRQNGWQGFWIDAASTLRMESNSVIVLDPVNRQVIDDALANGIKDFIGGNCTVSLMLMALGGLFEKDLIEWMTSMTYQAASGAGANNMRELVSQMHAIGDASAQLLSDPATAIQELDRKVTDTLREGNFPDRIFRRPPGRQPDSLDRSPHGERPDPRGVEGHCRNQQDSGAGRPIPFPSTGSVSASGPCGATARLLPSS